MTGNACCRVGSLALLLAQLAWAVSAFHESTKPDPPRSIEGQRALAVGTLGLAIALAAGSTRYPSLTMPAATASLISTATTGWYASSLNRDSVVARTGYGAALFSTAASLLLLVADMDGQHAATQPNVVVLAPLDPPYAEPDVVELGQWEYVDVDIPGEWDVSRREGAYRRSL